MAKVQDEENPDETKRWEDQSKENPAETREWDNDDVAQANEDEKESRAWEA